MPVTAFRLSFILAKRDLLEHVPVGLFLSALVREYPVLYKTVITLV